MMYSVDFRLLRRRPRQQQLSWLRYLFSFSPANVQIYGVNTNLANQAGTVERRFKFVARRGARVLTSKLVEIK